MSPHGPSSSSIPGTGSSGPKSPVIPAMIPGAAKWMIKMPTRRMITAIMTPTRILKVFLLSFTSAIYFLRRINAAASPKGARMKPGELGAGSSGMLTGSIG